MFHSDVYLMHGRGGSTRYINNDLQVLKTGGGLRSVFSTIFSNVVPFVKSAFRIGSKVAKSNVGQELTKHLKKSAQEAGVAVVNDALQGKNVLQSSKQQVAKVAKSMSDKVSELDQAAVRKPKKKKGSKNLSKSRRKRITFRTGGNIRVTKTKKKGTQKYKLIAAGKKKTKSKKRRQSQGRASSKDLVPTGVHTLKDLWS